ncbi:MAG: CHASE2 domain-containing protein, partial [Cyanobacteria bacterium P01_F01_bin.86]
MLPVVNYTLNELKTLFQKSWEWRIGYVLIGVFIAARWLGVFSSIELNTLDFFLRYRPAEKEDEHVVIVLIDRSSFQGNDTVNGATTDQYITKLLETILAAEPAVVGLNIFKEQSADKESREKLANLFETNHNLIGAQKILPPNEVSPLAEVSPQVAKQQFGFNDVPIDRDGKVRRIFVGSYLPEDPPDSSGENPFGFSFSFKVATKYLENKGYSLENFPPDPATPSFRVKLTDEYIKIPRLHPTFGGYVRENSIADIQTLLNFRSGTRTFNVFYSENLLDENFDLQRLEDKVVIVGSTDSTFPRFLPISASSNLGNKDTEYRHILPRLGIIGAELEAHSTSQIINQVLHDRPLIETISPFLEYTLILLAGVVGILIGNAFKSSQATFQNMTLLVFVVGSLVASGYLLLYWLGIWFPIFPASSILAITGVTYIAFYQRERFSLIESKKLEEEALRLEEETLRLEEERRKTIDKIFNSIHAGPLQTLASLLRDVRDGKLNQEHLTRDLEFLN